MNDAYRALEPLMKKKSNLTDPKQFQSLINVIFHNEEARYYDSVHEEMWKSLPQQYNLLIDDIRSKTANKANLKILDIGCGTGLATQMLLNTNLNNAIEEVHLLDTSPVMLSQAKKRAKNWRKVTRFLQGDITAVTGIYDIIIVSSVLHHIPDLAEFLNAISRLQHKGSILFTIHDPTYEAVNSEIYQSRCEDYSLNSQYTQPKLSLMRRAVNKVKRIVQPQDYIAAVNKNLLAQQIINQPLTPKELWSVTDIHVEGLPYSASEGISKQVLADCLPGYRLIAYRTYAFYGTLLSNLTNAYQVKEHELCLQGDLNGRNFGSVWIKEIE